MSISPRTCEDEEGPLAVVVSFDAKHLRVRLSDGREVSAPVERFPRLRNANAAARENWRLIADGVGIHWPDVDEDISVASLLGLPSDL